MDGLELGLSHGFRLAVMARYSESIKRYGVWGRAVTAMVMVFAACLFASPTWRTMQLLPLLAGLAFAWVDAYPSVVEPGAGDGVLRRWLAAQTVQLSMKATANLAGLLEGFGVVAAALLFAGPLPASMPAAARVSALAALIAFGWNAFSQVVGDPGYYNMNPAPARWTMAIRWLLPAAAAAAALLILRQHSITNPAITPVPAWTAALLAGSFLLIWPYAATLDLLLRCATASAEDEVTRNLGAQGQIHYEYVHRAKNELRPDFRDIHPGDAEYLAYTDAIVTVDNAIRDIHAFFSGNHNDAHTVKELWRRYCRTISGTAARNRLKLTDATASLKLSRIESLILQSIIVGLVSNALRASSDGTVEVTVSDEMLDEETLGVRVMVEDQGAGCAPIAFERGSGLAHLHNLCSLYNGGVSFGARDGGGTRAIAKFSYSRPASGVGDMAHPSRKEISDGQLPGPDSRRPFGIHIGGRRLAAPGK